jgi:xanthine dehydrogenase accessory factor
MTTHPLTREVYQTVVEWLDAGTRFALVTVLKDAGSTPRKAGTRAIVDAEGNLWGTIGGGLLESEARAAAVGAVRTGAVGLFDFRFAGASARGDDPVCGGTMRVLIDPTVPSHRAAYERAADALRERRRGLLLTAVANVTLRVSVTWLGEGDTPGDGAAAEAVAAAHSTQAPQYFAGPSQGLAEPVIPIPLLLVAGGGHVAQALARQAVLLGWEVRVVDDRAEFADPLLYPAGIDARRGRFRDVATQWPLNRDTYVAVVGRGHKVDADALAAVIDKPVGYLGMMGSRRKVALLRNEFLESGLATAEQFDRVHAPIGLDIGAQTVEEIAAAIVAQLVAVRRGRYGR